MDGGRGSGGRQTVAINLCDDRHQPIAFQGAVCPLCRAKWIGGGLVTAAVDGTASPYRADLDRALRTHYVARLERIVEGHRAVLGG